MNKTRKYRKKKTFTDEVDLGVELSSEQNQVVVKSKELVSKSQTKLNSFKKLSFAEEDGEDDGEIIQTFKMRRKKDNKDQKQEDSKELNSSTQVSAVGSYTPEMIKELKKNTLKYEGGSKKAMTKSLSVGSGEHMITFKGSFKPVDPAKDDRFEINATALAQHSAKKEKSKRKKVSFIGVDDDFDDDNDNNDKQQQQKLQDNDVISAEKESSRVGLEQILAVDEADIMEEVEEEYPDNDIVEKAKQYRASRRLAYLPADYVAPNWEDLKNRGVVKVQHADEIGEDDEDEEHDHLRMAFMGTSSKQQLQRMRQQEISAGLATNVEDEDVEKQWEQAQSRRAIVASTSVSEQQQQNSNSVSTTQQSVAEDDYMQPFTDEAARQQAEQVLTCFQQSIEKQKQQQQEEQGKITKIHASVTLARQQIEKSEEQQKELDKKYSYVQILRDYVQDLCECLDAKSSLIEELEDQLYKLRQDRSTTLRNEVEIHNEEWETIAKAVAEAVMKCIRSGNSRAAKSIAEKTIKETQEKLLDKNHPPNIDEFGRDLNMGERQKAEKRQHLRKHITLMAQEYIKQQEELPPELLLIKEDDSEIQHYDQRKGELLEAAKRVFEDAAEEFGTLDGVVRNLETWRSLYPKMYQQAYVATSSLALYAPFIRLKLLEWEPLYISQNRRTLALIEQSWIYKLLPVSSETEVVPKLIDKLAVPQATQMIQQVWDPLKEYQCTCVFDILKDFLAFQSKEELGQEFQKLLKEVEEKLRGAIQRLDFPQWPTVVEDAHVVLRIYVENQFQRAVQILKGINRFQQVLSESLLKDMVLQQLLTDKLCPYFVTISSNAEVLCDRVRKILDNFPRNWKWSELRPMMQPFVDVLLSSARQLQAQSSRWRRGDNNASDTPRKLASLLLQFGEVERATKLTDSCRL